MGATSSSSSSSPASSASPSLPAQQHPTYTVCHLCHKLQVDNSPVSKTRSSAVTVRPRDASCLSVVSFNNTISRAQSSITGYFSFRITAATIKFCSLLFGVVVHASCDKQGSLMCGVLCGKWTSMLSAINYCMVDRRECWSHFISHWSESQIVVENHNFCLPHLHSTPPLGGPRRIIAITFGIEKLEWCGYQSWKKVEDMFIRFDRIHKRDRWTDSQTDGHRAMA